MKIHHEPITFTGTVTVRQLFDQVVTWLDSGTSNYWIDAPVEVVLPDGFDPLMCEWLTPSERPWKCRTAYFAPFVAGGKLIISVDERDDENEEEALTKYALDWDAIQRGVVKMLACAPDEFAKILSEDGDAATADLFIQHCLFGEEVY